MNSDSVHIGPVGTEGIFTFTASDACLHLYVKTKSAFRYWRSISTGTVMYKVWYLPNFDYYATSGSDFKLSLWRIH